MGDVYFDNNATTQVAPEVVDAMLPFLTEQFGNPSSLHNFGNRVAKSIANARRSVQTLLGAKLDTEVVFTSCGSESDSTAILSAVRAYPERKEIITTVVEHPAVLNVCSHLEKEGYKVHWLKVDDKGRLDLNEYREALSDQVAVVSVMWANNETGTLFPVVEMAQLAHEKGVLFHTDAVQAVGKIPLDIKSTKIDMLSLSGHKLHAPKGVGALYVRRGTRFRPLLRGGHQERGRRAGTENVPGVVALGRAAELAQENLSVENTKVRGLRDRLEAELLKVVPRCFVTGNPEDRLPNTSNIAFEFIEGEAILLLLNRAGIAASSGSACTSGSLEPSHVMKAMGIPYTAAHGTVRFSLSPYNTMADVDQVIAEVPGVVERLRKLSPYWGEEGPKENPEEAFSPVYA